MKTNVFVKKYPKKINFIVDIISQRWYYMSIEREPHRDEMEEHEMRAYMNAYEQDGKFLFEDDNTKWETTELIDTDELEYDECTGYIYNGQPLDNYIIREA